MSSTTLIKLLCVIFTSFSHVQSVVLPEKRQSGLSVFELDGWQSLGCWSDSQASRTLSLMAHSGQHCSDDNCQYQCTQLGYNYAGTEYSGQCYCDDYVNSIATQKPDGDCNMACTGNSSQPCGGADRINLFWNGKTAPPKPATVMNPGVDGWASEGCYTDSTGARTLTDRVNTNGGGSVMTVQLCVDACHSAGYSLAGVEYGGECYCDSTINNGGSSASDQTSCSMTCNGNSTEYCGGPGRLNLYSFGGASPVAAAPTTTTTVPTVKPTLPSNFASLGCYTDTNGKRALSRFYNSPDGKMTVETCINLCSTNGYNIAGVEYGSECYCDNSVQNNHGLASDGNAGCDMPCSGNAGETCGGPNRLNAYAAGPAWVQLGCFSDQPYSRTLANTGSYTGDLTVESCLASCQGSGYAYAGVEYGRECYCGSSFDNGGGPAPDGSAGCSFPCAGNSSEICGGSQRLSLYEYIDSNGVVKSTTPTQTTTNPAASTTTSGPAPNTDTLPAGWSYDGCYIDNAHGRILSSQQSDSDTLTIESCIATCASNSYVIAGLEYSRQCFCGNAIINGGEQDAANDANAHCHMPCSGNATESCGGPGLMEIYAQGTLKAQAPAAVQTNGLPDGWAYQDCISDQVGQRTLPVEKDFSTNSATTCLNYCSSQGYTVAGLEYANQCFCGNAADITSSGPTTSSNCDMACSGDNDFICVGPGALSYYSMASN